MNEGSPDATSCGYSYMRVGADAAGTKRRAILQFDISSLPEGAVIESADLALYLESTLTTRVEKAVYTVRSPGKAWTNEVSWGSPNGTSETWLGGNPTDEIYSSIELNGSTSGYKHLFVESLVNRWVTGDKPARGFLLKQRDESVNSVLFFASSSDANDVTKWPKLVIEYVDPTKSMSAAATEAQWQAMLQCMQRHAEVQPSATVAEIFGQVAHDGTFLPPTTPGVVPSEGCVSGATDLIIQTLQGVRKGDSPNPYLYQLRDDLRNGVVTSPDGWHVNTTA